MTTPLEALTQLNELRLQERASSKNIINAGHIREAAHERFKLLNQTLETLCEEYGHPVCTFCNKIAESPIDTVNGWECEKHTKRATKQTQEKFERVGV